MKLQNQYLQFAAGSETLYNEVSDYYNEYRALKTGKNTITYDKSVTFAEKQGSINGKILAEIGRKAGVDVSAMRPSEFATHPLVAWATFAVISALVDMVLPESLIDSIGTYTEFHTVGYGDSLSIAITPRDLFAVSKAGHAKRQGELKKQYAGQVTIVPVNHQISVYVDLFRVLAGLESLAEFMAKCAQSIETQMAYDAYAAFDTAMVALPLVGGDANAFLRVAGYTQDSLISLAQKVTAYNGGRQAVIVGTKLALSKILPANGNYRYSLESDYVKLGFIRDFFGYSLIELPQVANWATPFTLKLDDTHIYVVSPSANKLIHLALGGDTLSYTAQPYDNANLIQEGTLMKAWEVAIATNAIAGIITL